MTSEERSVEDLIDELITEVRPRGTSVVVTHVLVTAVRAATDMTVRNRDGTVDEENAREILMDASDLLRTWCVVKRTELTEEQFMPKINGVSFRCDCGCNVFRKRVSDLSRYVCNSCQAVFVGVPS